MSTPFSDTRRSPPRGIHWSVVTLLLCAGIVVASGISFHADQSRRLTESVERQLGAIARLKADQIAAWRAGRLDEGKYLTKRRLLSDLVRRRLRGESGADDQLLAEFRVIAEHAGYANVSLVDVTGRRLVSLRETPDAVPEDTLDSIAAALARRAPEMTELHAHTGNPVPHITVIAPLFEGSGADAAPLGAILLLKEARQSLFPLVQSWPLPSNSAEVLLVRRDGGDALFLNELRHMPDAALSLRIPLTHTEVPAVKAVLGLVGVSRGVDYRGVEVIAATLPVPDSGWFIVAKEDAAEALASWRVTSYVILALTLSLTAFAAAAIAVGAYRARSARFEALYEAEAKAARIGRLYEMLSNTNQLIVRSDDPMALLSGVCGIAVQSGGFRFAWAGKITGDGRITPVARAGADHGYIDQIEANMNAAAPRGMGPTAQALRDNHPIICNDFLSDSATRPWHTAARAAGVAASAAFPINLGGGGRGAINFYSGSPGFFGEHEIETLKEMASDLSYALDNMARDRERALAVAEVRQLSDRLAHYLSVSPVINYVLRLDGVDSDPEWVSENVLDLLGYTPDEVLSPDWWSSHLHPDDAPGAMAAFSTLAQLGALHHEYRFFRKDGTEIWVLDNVKVLSDADGAVQRAIGAWSDITGLKRAEAKLREGEARLLRQRDAMISLAGIESAAEDLVPALKRITETAARTMGIDRVSVWQFTPDRSAILCLDLYDAPASLHTAGMTLVAGAAPAYFQALERGEIIAANDAETDPRTREFTDVYLRPLGIAAILDAPIFVRGALAGVLCHEHIGAPREWNGDELTFAAACANIVSLAIQSAERQRAESLLRLHGAALNAAANAIVITDPNGTIEWVNPAYSRLTGYAAEEAIGKNPRDLVKSGRHDPAFYERMWKTILAGEVWRGELLNRRKDGTIYPEEQTITPLRDASGAISHFIAIKTDISERRRAEESLRAAQERLQRAMTAGNIGLWDWEPATGVAEYSGDWLAQIGIDGENLTGTLQDWLERVHPDDAMLLRDSLLEVDRYRDTPLLREFRLRHEDGSYRWMLMSASAVTDAEGRVARVAGANVDITERKHLEQQFLQAQKMESVGRLAGGVAHDFNNILGVIGGYCEFALDALPGDSPLHHDVLQIKHAAERAVGLTRQLLAFSRRQVLQPKVLDLNQVIADASKMLKRLIGEDIDFVVRCGENLGRVLADSGQIEQVLMNLAVNARDAMPMGGCLTIETGNETIDPAYTARHAGMTPGDFVRLSVTDNGIGMDKETIERIFDPFFTTKEQGKGTGLGLATVYGIVKQSGGSIWVYSELGRGTTFKIYLPRITDAVHEPEPKLGAGALERGNETVLIVEDEENLRELTERTLTLLGYTVFTATGGAQALEYLESHNSPIHLLLTDIVMPEMNGPELAAEIVKRLPAIRVLFMSGYPDDAILHHGILDPKVHLISKPFSIAQLARKVREVLNTPPA